MSATRPCSSCDHPVPADAAFCPVCGVASASPILGDTLIGASRASSGTTTSYELAPDRLRAALGPNYELGRLIGRGGYAEVFAVRDLRLKRELALKVLRPDLDSHRNPRWPGSGAKRKPSAAAAPSEHRAGLRRGGGRWHSLAR